MAVVVAGAHRHDLKRLAETLEAVVVGRPESSDEAPQQLCADKGDDDEACRQQADPPDDLPHIRSRGEEQREKHAIPGSRARRWVVAVWHAWLHRVRKILVRVEKKLATHLARRQFACADIVRKRAKVFR
jgi:putative transposase